MAGPADIFRCPRWTRLKAFFGNQLFATAFFGIAIILKADVVKDLLPDERLRAFGTTGFCAVPQCLGGFAITGSQLLPLSTTAFIAAGAFFFFAGLVYSLRVPGVISGYTNRGDFVKAYKGENGVNEGEKREEWENCNKESYLSRLIVCLLIGMFLGCLFLFVGSSFRIAFFSLLGR